MLSAFLTLLVVAHVDLCRLWHGGGGREPWRQPDVLQDEVVWPVRDVGVVAVGEEEPDAVGGDGHEGEGDGLGGGDAGQADQGGEVAAVDVTAKK